MKANPLEYAVCFGAGALLLLMFIMFYCLMPGVNLACVGFAKFVCLVFTALSVVLVFDYFRRR